jgi:hypothetical protein
MTVEILKEGIRTPAPNNLTWVFPVKLDGRSPIDWKVDDFDLSIWFKEAVGRYPRHEGGDQEEKEDILENWSRLEAKLRQQVEKQAQLPFELGVDIGRTGPEEWRRAQAMPKEELPPLSDAQRATAKRLGVSEESYARMIFGQELTAKSSLVRTEMLARLLSKKLCDLGSKATIEKVVWRTLDDKFDVAVKLNGDIIPLRIDEGLVDSLFDSGSADAEQRLARILSATVGLRESQLSQ